MAEAMTGDQVVLLGATGQIGVFCIPRLLAAGCRVLAVSRQPPNDYPRLTGLSWVAAGEWETAEVDAPALVSAGPIALAARAVGRLPALRQAVVFSTSSVISKRQSADARERDQVRLIRDAEVDLRQLCADRGIGLILLRPTLVYGCGLDQNVSQVARWLRRCSVLPLAGAAAGLRQPVHADDLASAAVAALRRPAGENLELSLGGGSTLSYREMVRRIAAGIGVRARLPGLPAGMLAAMAALGRRLPGLGGVSPAMVRRQARDLLVEDAAARELLGFDPRPFRPCPGDFARPSAADLRAMAEP